MPYKSLAQYSQASSLLLHWRPRARLSQPRFQLSWRSIVHSAERLFSIIGRPARWAIRTLVGEGPTRPRLPTDNTRYEIMRIEARRRI
jgi:hypothetical protein